MTAFNDIALVRVPGDGLATIGVAVEGKNFVNYAADALSERLELDVLAGGGRLAVEVDGIIEGYAGPGDRLAIEPVRAAARVIRLDRTSFYERAQRKLRVQGSAEAVVQARPEHADPLPDPLTDGA